MIPLIPGVEQKAVFPSELKEWNRTRKQSKAVTKANTGILFKKGGKKLSTKSIKERSIVMKILSFKSKSKPKIKLPVPFGTCLMKMLFWNCFSKCRTKTMLYCQAFAIIFITHFLPLQIVCPAVHDTFYVNRNIKMKIGQTRYNWVMALAHCWSLHF